MSFKEKFDTLDIAVAGKWLFNFVLIGVIAGLGSIVFHYLCGLGMAHPLRGAQLDEARSGYAVEASELAE